MSKERQGGLYSDQYQAWDRTEQDALDDLPILDRMLIKADLILKRLTEIKKTKYHL